MPIGHRKPWILSKTPARTAIDGSRLYAVQASHPSNPNSSLKLKATAFLCAGVSQLAAAEPPTEPMSVWFTAPARSYHESCPLGNGRLGAMDFGGVDSAGSCSTSRRFGPAAPTMRTARMPTNACRKPAKLCFPATSMPPRTCSVPIQIPEGVSGWWDENQFGCYQILGDLTLQFKLGGKRSRRHLAQRPRRGKRPRRRREVRYDVAPRRPPRRDRRSLDFRQH